MEERLKAAATEQKASALKATRNASMNGSMNGSMAYILPVDQQLSLEPDSMQGKLIFYQVTLQSTIMMRSGSNMVENISLYE